MELGSSPQGGEHAAQSARADSDFQRANWDVAREVRREGHLESLRLRGLIES